MEQAINSFQKGLQLDNHPISQNNDVLTDALNATFVTMNDNEGVLQNDMGNAKVNGAFLDPGYVPVGIKEYGGIIYLAAYNPVTNRSQIGSFPSPERVVDKTSQKLKQFRFSQFWDSNNLESVYPKDLEESEEFEDSKPYYLKRDAILLQLTEDLYVHAGDKFVINSTYIWENKDFITNFNNIKKGKVNSPKNNYYTLSIGVINSQNNFVDITQNLIRFDKAGNRISSKDKSKLYLFNEGYFIKNEFLKEISEITKLEDFRKAPNLNTYSYKLIGPLYLKVQFNHIKNIELNIVPEIKLIPVPPKPVFNPIEGDYIKGETLNIEIKALEGATIYYTTDGTDPDITSSVYSTAIPVTDTTTIKAIAVKDDKKSKIATATYNLKDKMATPTFSVEEGTYTEAQSVTISTTTEGATIYYTIDGTDPTTESNLYSEAISITETTTLKAIAVKEGYFNSDIATAEYIINKVKNPVFSHIEGSYNYFFNVEITTETDGATIYYTTDGTDPTTTSSVYSTPIPVTETTTLKAIAVKGEIKSYTVTVKYTINKVKNPVFTSEGSEGEELDITITSSEGATIYYTTDGSDPTINSNVYRDTIHITETTIFKAFATKEEMIPSDIVTQIYSIKSLQPQMLLMNPIENNEGESQESDQISDKEQDKPYDPSEEPQSEDQDWIDREQWDEEVNIEYTKNGFKRDGKYVISNDRLSFNDKYLQRFIIYKTISSVDKLENYPFNITRLKNSTLITLIYQEDENLSHYDYTDYKITITQEFVNKNKPQEVLIRISYIINLIYSEEEPLPEPEDDKIIVNLKTNIINIQVGKESNDLLSYITNLNDYPGLNIKFEKIQDYYDIIEETSETKIKGKKVGETYIICKYSNESEEKIYTEGNISIPIVITEQQLDDTEYIEQPQLLVIENITYNCPDGIDEVGEEHESNDLEYYSYYEGTILEENSLYPLKCLKGYHLLNDKELISGEIIKEEEDENNSIYDKNNNEYKVIRIKRFKKLSEPDEKDEVKYKLVVPIKLPDDGDDKKFPKDPILLKNLTYDGSFNMKLINTGTILIKGWRFYNNIAAQNTILTYDLEGYPEYNKNFADLRLKFIDVISDKEVYVFDSAPSLNGPNTITIPWENKLQFRNLYKVIIEYKYEKEQDYKTIDNNKHFILTTELFNNCYNLESSQYVKHYGNPTKSEQSIIDKLLTIDFETNIAVFNNVNVTYSESNNLIKKYDHKSELFSITQNHTITPKVNTNLQILNEDYYPYYIKLKPTWTYKLTKDVNIISSIGENDNRQITYLINSSENLLRNITISNIDKVLISYRAHSEMYNPFKKIDSGILASYRNDVNIYGKIGCEHIDKDYVWTINCSDSATISTYNESEGGPFVKETLLKANQWDDDNTGANVTRYLNKYLNNVYEFFNSYISKHQMFIFQYNKGDFNNDKALICNKKITDRLDKLNGYNQTTYSRVWMRTTNDKWAIIDNFLKHYSEDQYQGPKFSDVVNKIYDGIIYCYKNYDNETMSYPTLSNDTYILEYKDKFKINYLINYSNIEIENKINSVLNFTYQNSIEKPKSSEYEISISDVFISQIDKIRRQEYSNIYIEKDPSNNIKTAIIDVEGNELNPNNAYKKDNNGNLVLTDKFKCNTDIQNNSGYNLLLPNSNELIVKTPKDNLDGLLFNGKQYGGQLVYDNVLTINN